MIPSRDWVCRACLILLLAVGLGFLLVGTFVVPIRSYFQLDAVLSPAELADPARRDATLVLLKKASGNEWLMWVAGGLVVTIASAIGLKAAWRP